jgi:hypothetical protein
MWGKLGLPALRGLPHGRHLGSAYCLQIACETGLLRAQQALNQPAPSPPAREPAQALMAWVAGIDLLSCPQCQNGPLRVVERLGGA